MLPPFSEDNADDQQKPEAENSSSKQLDFSPRIFSLDVLRGIAVLAALFVSIWLFGGFSTNKQNGLLLESKGFDYRLYGAMNLLLEGKMRALIALVFGAGMLLFLTKDNVKGAVSNNDFFMRRQLWLIILGIINGILLLWSGDVLFHLGIMGILLFPFVRLSARGLVIASVVVLFIYSGKNYWRYDDDKKAYGKYVAVTKLEKKIEQDSIAKVAAGAKDVKKDTLTKKQQNEKQAWTGLIASMKVDPKKDDGNNKSMRSKEYGKLWNHILPTTQARQAQWTYQFGVWDFASMILLGMAVFKFGFFTSRFSKKHYFLLAITTITLGLLFGWFRLHMNQVALHDYEKYVSRFWMPYNMLFPFERAFLALGYTSLVLLCIASGFLNFVWKAFAKVGQLALSNYLIQSIILGFIFLGFGMGYFGRLQQVHLYFIVVEVIMVQVIFSVLWLRKYRYGPAEILWRRLVYGKGPTNRKSKPEIPESTIPALYQ